MLIVNANILTMTGQNIADGYVYIDQGKIIEIGEMEQYRQNALKFKDINTEMENDVFDADGRFLLPGFIDAHCHIGLWEDSVGFEGEDGNEMTDPVTPHLRAIDGVFHDDRSFQEARESGVTTVVTGPGSANVIGGQFAALKTTGRSVDEMVILQPAAMKIAFGENPKTVYNEKRQMPMTRMATAALLRENLMKAREYKEMLDDYYKNKEENDKPEYEMKMEALLPVLRKEIPLKAHAHRADDILTAIRIAKEFDLKISLEHCTEGYLIKDILKEQCIPIIVGPMLTDRSKIELRNQSLKNPGILSKAGIKVAIMTDHPCVPIQHLVLCAAIAAKEGMPEEDALKAITLNAAEAVGLGDRIGSIEVGKDADLVLYAGHPFELRSKVCVTIINGKVVFKRDLD